MKSVRKTIGEWSDFELKYEAILFDMDGTLLPMDQRIFVKHYFGELAKVLAPYGVDGEALNTALWGGVRAMVKNDGTKSNEEVFWDYFDQYIQIEQGRDELESIITKFYTNEFHKVKEYMGENPLARKMVETAHAQAPKVILATNPIFPMVAQLSRLSWVGLGKEDFDFVTAYEDQYFCKPNPKYFEKICKKMNVDPKNCLMIGNDELEDMHTASSLGMDCYMVTGSEILREGFTWNGKKGTFEELIEWLER